MALRKVIGTLVFQEKFSGADKPLHNTLLELWDLDLIANDYLGRGETDLDGRFEITYDSGNAGWLDKPDLVLRVYQRGYYYNKDGSPRTETKVIANFDAGDDITDECFDFGLRRVPFWEYANPEEEGAVAFTPRVRVIKGGEPPQTQRFGRQTAQISAVLPVSLPMVKFSLENKFNDQKPTVDKITERYPENLTQKMDKSNAYPPNYSRSDAYLCDIVQNGHNPCLLQKGDDGLYYAAFKWNGLEQDGIHFAPNTTAYFSIQDDALTLEKIMIQKRVGGEHGAHATYRAPKFYTAADGDEIWDRVKRLFRVNYFLFGEALTHLGETHLNIEQYILPIVRNLHKNPVGRLMIPHFYGTVAINFASNDLLITEAGLVGSTSAATPQSVGAAIRLAFGGYNWYGWKPRVAVGKNDRFAGCSKIYWEMLTGYVDWYFAENDAAIRDNWAEVHRMSQELVGHALPYQAPSGEGWWDTNELNTDDNPHPRVNGEVVAVSPVTESDTADDQGLANLKQMCRYLLFFNTFKHKWVNDSQYDMGGEVMYATLGVKDDLTNLEVDAKTAVRPQDGLVHPFYTYTLSYTKYGYIIRNEDNDMNPELIKRLVACRNDLAALQVDIRDIRCTINI